MAYSVFEPTVPEVLHTGNLDGRLVRPYVSMRIANALLRANVRNLGQLCALPRSKVQGVPGLGEHAMRDLDGVLTSLGLGFADEEPPKPCPVVTVWRVLA